MLKSRACRYRKAMGIAGVGVGGGGGVTFCYL